MTDQTPPSQAGGDSEQAAAYQAQWGEWTRRMATIVLLIAVVYTITLLRPVVQMLIIAFILAFLMAAPSRAIARRTPIPYGLAVTLLYLTLIVMVLFLILVFIPAFVNWANGLLDNIELAYANLQAALRDYEPSHGIIDIFGYEADLNFIIIPFRDFVLGTNQNVAQGTDVPPGATGDAPAESAGQTPQGEGLFGPGGLLESVDLRELLNGFINVAAAITGTLTSAITSVAGFAITTIMALFISFLILLDLPRAEDALTKWIPAAYHREYALLVSEIVRVWNGFFKGQVMIGVIIGALTWLQLSLMGVAGAEILAVFTGAISLIPTIGGLIALVPLALVPLFQGSSVFTEMPNGLLALLVVGVSLLVQQVIWNAIAPKILGNVLDLPLPVIIVGVFIGAALGGILGAFLVAPIMGTVRVVVFYVLSKIAQRDPFPGKEAPESYRTFAEARARLPRREQVLEVKAPDDAQ